MFKKKAKTHNMENNGELLSAQEKKKLIGRKSKTNISLTSKEKKKVEKGVDQILRPLKIIKISAIVLAILNLTLPVIKNTLGFKSIWGYLLCIVYYYAVKNSRGLFYEYNIPIGWVLIIRTLQLAIHLVKWFDPINLAFYFVAIVGDALFFAFLFYHRSVIDIEVERYVK